MVCEHAALMDMCYDVLFQIPAKYEEECAEFRRRVGRREGMQKEEEETKRKKKGWDGMICGGDDDSYESESLSSKRYEQFLEDRGFVLTGMGGGGERAAMD